MDLSNCLMLIMCALYIFFVDQRRVANQSVRCGAYYVSYSPANFEGRLLEYVRWIEYTVSTGCQEEEKQCGRI